MILSDPVVIISLAFCVIAFGLMTSMKVAEWRRGQRFLKAEAKKGQLIKRHIELDRAVWADKIKRVEDCTVITREQSN